MTTSPRIVCGDVWVDLDDPGRPVVIELVAATSVMVSRLNGALDWLDQGVLRSCYRRAGRREAGRLWQTVLSSHAVYEPVVDNEDGTVTCRVVDVPGLEPGSRVRLTRKAVEAMRSAA
jgi:hypothetical protein